MTGLGLVGCGNWGFNYLKTLSQIPEAKLLYVCDLHDDNLKKVSTTYPHLKTTKYYQILLEDDSVDGVIIATPPDTHFPIVVDFLERNKAVLVEKPITLSYDNTVNLIAMAQKNNTILMAGHLMEYHPVVVKLHEYISKEIFGKIRYISLDRAGLGKNRMDVLWDLAVHDLSIISYLINKNPLWVSAQGKSFLQDNIHDLVTITMEFPDDLFVQIHANSIYPQKTRQMVIAGDILVAVLDDTRDNYKLQLIPYDGDIILPKIDTNLPLTLQCKHFINCIQSNVSPKTGSTDILWVMKLVDLIKQSLLGNGSRQYFR